MEQDKRTGRDTKVPYSPTTGYKASSANPKTWGTLDEAIFYAEKYMFKGIGYMFTEDSGIVGIDIDHCLDDEGKPSKIVASILAKLPSTYIEISPSGHSLHIFLRGTLPKCGNKNSKNGVEMYYKSRYSP